MQKFLFLRHAGRTGLRHLTGLGVITGLLLSLPAAATPRVLATIKPVHALTAAVMKEVESPELLTDGAVSAHSYALKPSDARRLAAADLIFEVGPDMESWLQKPLKTLAKGQVVILARAKGVKTLPARAGRDWGETHDHSGYTDPHIWLSPENAAAMVRAIRDSLKTADPAHAGRYNFNAKMEIARINDMAMAIGSKLMGVHNRPYLVFHDAYQYFEAYYNLHPIGAVMISPDRPVSPRRLARLRRDIPAQQHLCLFREPQFSPSLIPTLREGKNIRVDVLDPLGADLEPGPDLYRKLMMNLTGALTRCLR